jgi:hypothetical protein
MIPTGRVNARNYGDSPVTRVYVPIASAVFQSCWRMPLAALKRLTPSICGTVFEAPLRVDSGVLATPSQARARDLAPTLCRALMV